MTRRREPHWARSEERDARIRELRHERAEPFRRRRPLEPLAILAWFAGVAVLVGILIYVGFRVVLAPQLLQWVEDNPGTIEHAVVRDFVVWFQPDALADEPASDSTERVSFTVEPGESATEIGARLADAGLVRSQLAFLYAVQQAGRARSLEIGEYDLSPSLRPSEIVAALQHRPGIEVTITIGEGWRLEEIVAYLSNQPLTMDLDQFVSLVKEPPGTLIAAYGFLQNLPVGRTLEGYLAPDTYRVFQNADAETVLAKMLDQTAAIITPEVSEQIAGRTILGRQMTVDDALVIASIVEREAVLDEERALIAGVYINRLNTPTGETAGFLQADPTLQYGLATDRYLLAPTPLPTRDWDDVNWWPPLETGGSEVLFENAPEALAGYQTYVNKGLPPTPISASRAASILATAAADTAAGYFFFVAACPDGERDGSHYFAKTHDQHLANVARANEECAGS